MKLNLLAALGAVAMIIGGILPWYTEVFSTGAELVQHGLEDGNGYNAILYGGILLLLSILAGESRSIWKLIPEGLISVVMFLFGLSQIFLSAEIVNHSPENSWGPGLWIMMTGAFLYLLTFVFSLMGKRRLFIKLELS